jgi:hypothetical protein
MNKTILLGSGLAILIGSGYLIYQQDKSASNAILQHKANISTEILKTKIAEFKEDKDFLEMTEKWNITNSENIVCKPSNEKIDCLIKNITFENNKKRQPEEIHVLGSFDMNISNVEDIKDGFDVFDINKSNGYTNINTNLSNINIQVNDINYTSNKSIIKLSGNKIDNTYTDFNFSFMVSDLISSVNPEKQTFSFTTFKNNEKQDDEINISMSSTSGDKALVFLMDGPFPLFNMDKFVEIQAENEKVEYSKILFNLNKKFKIFLDVPQLMDEVIEYGEMEIPQNFIGLYKEFTQMEIEQIRGMTNNYQVFTKKFEDLNYVIKEKSFDNMMYFLQGKNTKLFIKDKPIDSQIKEIVIE